MSKKIYILFIISILTSSVFGQFVGKDNLSISLFYMQKTELDSAKKYIDLATQDSGLVSAAKTWYWRGYIYKDIYKTKEKTNKTSSTRLVAITSYKKVMTLEGKDQFTKSTKDALKYLASTLYNDAARMLNPQDYKQAIINYEQFRTAMFLVNPDNDLIVSRDIKFKLALITMLMNSSTTKIELDTALRNQVKQLYIEILVIDTNNAEASYGLGILYYNEGADIINSMDYDMDLIKLNKIQDQCISIFLKGLPYMKKSYDLQYKREATLIGLSNIYYSLNDLEKHELYKKELEELEAKNRYLNLKNKLKELEVKGVQNTNNEYLKIKEKLQKLEDRFKDLEKE